nr:MAG TPA: Cotton fiber expressed protein [Caudoviricetes sp.]
MTLDKGGEYFVRRFKREIRKQRELRLYIE